jgi:hypothetical protein
VRYQAATAQFVDYSYESGISVASDIAMWGNGMSAFDFNNDGFDDLTIAENLSGIALYQSEGDGSFQMVDFVALNAVIKQVMWVDFDNDQDADLFATTNGSGLCLYERAEDGALIYRAEKFSQYAQFDGQGASWVDYDKDGWKDLFVCSYLYGQAPQYPNLLFHNDQGVFTEVGEQMGVASWANQSFQGVWTDFDQDGWKDLYVINDHEVGNEYYRNNAGSGFENLSAVNGAGVSLASMSNSVADFDRDGDFDVFVSNGGNQVLLQNTNSMFENVAAELGITAFTFAWSGLWMDHDNDGWQDLYLCNTNGYANGDNNFFWMNEEGEQFDEVEFESYEVSSFVAVTGDFNNDRFADMAVYNGYPSSVHVWLNNAQSNQNSIKLNLRGEVSDFFGVGAEVRAYIGGTVSLQQVLAGENYLAQNSASVIIGCGEATMIDSLVVKWPSGWCDRFFDVPVDSDYIVEEGETFTVSVHSATNFEFCQGTMCEVDVSHMDANFQGTIVWSNGQEVYEAQFGDTGSYSVTVTNQFGLQRTIAFNVHHFATPVIETILTGPLCYEQSNGTCTVISSDIDSINGNPFQSSLLFNQLASGTYEYAITDINGCARSLQFTIPETPAMNLVQTDYMMCAEAMELPQLIIEGAALPLEVLLEIGSSFEEGEQVVVVNDHNGCTANFSIFIEHFPAAEVEVQSDTACFGGVAAWSYDVMGDVQIVSAEVLNATQDELPAGDYVLQSMDEFGCVAQQIFTVNAFDPIHIEFLIDEQNAQLAAEVTGGVAPYEWQWSNGENASSIAIAGAGLYALNIEDAAECSASADTTIIISNVDDHHKHHSFYITPFNRFISFENAATGQFMVFDAQGRVVHSERAQAGRLYVDASAWACGRYVLVVTSD